FFRRIMSSTMRHHEKPANTKKAALGWTLDAVEHFYIWCHTNSVGGRPVLGHSGHVDLGARQWRHRHGWTRVSVQRVWLSQAAGSRRRWKPDRAEPLSTRVRIGTRWRRAVRLGYTGARRWHRYRQIDFCAEGC